MSSHMFMPPAMVYPNAVTAEKTPPSRGSFGPVFAVLAVVVVVSAIACIVGQICARCCSKSKQPKDSLPKQSKKQPLPKPSNREPHIKQLRRDHTFPEEDGDIEFGFGPRMPTGKKQGGKGDSKGQKPANYGGDKKETRFAKEAKYGY